MIYLRMFSRKAAAGLALLVGWLTVAAASAQVLKVTPKDDSGVTGSGAYVFAYMLFILGIVLGLMVVCRSANRRDRARPEDYVESALSEEAGPSKRKK
jgi:heme/copper-type cytochrome/quinol oxidase subunit 2